MQERPGVSTRRLVARVLSERGDPATVAQRLAEALAAALPVDGVGISLLCDKPYRLLLAASDAEAVVLEQAQITTGEGPCVDASATHRSVLVPDLAGSAHRRWPGFTDTARLHAPDVRAVFAFPLLLHGAGSTAEGARVEEVTEAVGCLDLYRRVPGTLTPLHYAEAAAAASAAVPALLAVFGAEGPRGRGAAAGEAPAPSLPGDAYAWPQVAQAVGVLADRWELTPEDALAALRAIAFSSDQLLPETARRFVGVPPPPPDDLTGG